ncbi:hypothetical protein QUF72_22720 [Desulfobacterales bacterium HSG2]|nr:hypothetical protein [Desulfobacterales bacterium HSG2]
MPENRHAVIPGGNAGIGGIPDPESTFLSCTQDCWVKFYRDENEATFFFVHSLPADTGYRFLIITDLGSRELGLGLELEPEPELKLGLEPEPSLNLNTLELEPEPELKLEHT